MRFVGLMVALIVIPTVVAFIPLRERLHAQSMLENPNPPKTAPEPIPATEGEKKIVIVVNKGGEIFIEHKRYKLSELKAEIPKLMKSYSENINDVNIYVRADANTPYITLTNVMSGIKETGVKKIWLVTQPVVASKPKQPVRREIARKKEEATEPVKPTEPSAITPPKEVEKGQEPDQAQASGSTTKEEIKPQPEKAEVPEEAKKAEVRKEEKKVVANVNYLDGIKITRWSLYVAWGFPTIHHVTIENTNDTAYKDIKIKASYYYSYYTSSGITEMGRATGTLPIALPPHSKKTYLEDGTHLEQSSACSMYVASGGIEVLGATLIEETNIQSSRKDELLLEFTDDGLSLVR